MFRAKLRSFWNGLFRRVDVETGMAEELKFHIEARAEDLVASGLSADEALRRAKLEFGSADKYKEEMRQARGLRLLDEFRADFKYAVRALRKNPTFSLAAILTLALGIGANALVFSVVRAVILRPLDYSNPDELVQLWESGKHMEGDWVSFPNFRDWARQAQSFTGLAAYTYNGTTISGDKEPEAVLALEVTDRFFDMLGVKPALGRTFVEGEDQPSHDHVAVISYALWQRRYAGDPNVMGRQVVIGARPHTIIGIMPSSFRFPNVAMLIDVWVAGSRRSDIEQRGSHNFWTIARLKPGVSLSEARAEMDTIAQRLGREFPEDKDVDISVAYLHDRVSGEVRPALLMLLGSVGLLLLLACANIANLLLSRAESRRREMAIREAIGAGRSRLIRQTLTESVLLAFLGAAMGLAVVAGILQPLLRWAPADIPRIGQTSIDLPVLFFTSAIALTAGILFGLAPAIVGGGHNVYEALKRSGARSSPERGSFAVRHILIASQVALAVILLVGAGLLLRSLIHVTRLDPGFRRERLFIAILNVEGQARYAAPEQQVAFFEEVVRRVRTVPGVESAAVTDSMPLSGMNDQGSFDIEGRSWSALQQQYGKYGPEANRPHVSSGYFEAMGIPVVQGRVFNEHDRADSQKVAVISDLAARTYWPNENPIGKRLSVRESKDGKPIWHEIVGVVHSTRHFGMEAAQKPEIYVPHTQATEPFMILVVRVEGDMDSVIRASRKQVSSLDPQQAGFGVLRGEDMLFGSETRRRFQTFLLGGFAVLAAFLAAIGIYGVAAYTVMRRSREVGIRLALGARRADVVLMILRQGMFTIVAGAIVGMLTAAALSRLLASLLFGVSPSDSSTFSSVLSLVLLIGVLSVYLPARAASRVDPAIVLTEE